MGRMRPVTGLRQLRLFAWFLGLVRRGRGRDPRLLPRPFLRNRPRPALRSGALGLFRPIALRHRPAPVSCFRLVFLGPVWFVLRFWMARQGDRVIGAKPAILPVWLSVWVALTIVQVVMAGADMPDPPPRQFWRRSRPPFDLLFKRRATGADGGRDGDVPRLPVATSRRRAGPQPRTGAVGALGQVEPIGDLRQAGSEIGDGPPPRGAAAAPSVQGAMPCSDRRWTRTASPGVNAISIRGQISKQWRRAAL